MCVYKFELEEDSVLCSGVVCVREYCNSTVDLFLVFVWFDFTRFVVVVVVVFLL